MPSEPMDTLRSSTPPRTPNRPLSVSEPVEYATHVLLDESNVLMYSAPDSDDELSV